MKSTPQPYVFISYSHDDADFAAQFSLRLQQARIPHFRDIDAIAWGESIPERVHSALEKATHQVVLISPGSEKSQWVAYEMGYARGRQVTLVPYLLHRRMTVPGFIANLRYLSSPLDETQFIASLKRMLLKYKISGREIKPNSNESFTTADDKKLLVKLACSTNLAMRKQAIEPAMRLGKAAIPILHDLLGYPRPHAVITAYNILGEIADERSLPFLQAGLYPQRTSSRKLRFPTAEYAANALMHYSADHRFRVLATIDDQVREQDIRIIIQGVNKSDTYNHLMRLHRENKFYEEWGSSLSGLPLMFHIDEEKSWPFIEELMSKNKGFDSFSVFRYVYPYVSIARKQKLLDHFLNNSTKPNSYDLERFIEALNRDDFPKDWVEVRLVRLEKLIQEVVNKYAEREDFLSKVRKVRAKFLTPDSPGRSVVSLLPVPILPDKSVV